MDLSASRSMLMNLCHCEESTPAVSLYGVRVPKSCADACTDVPVLPDDWIPVRSVGDILKCYLAERVARHRGVLALLQEEADAVNARVEELLRLEAHTLLNHIQQYEKDEHNVLSEVEQDRATLQTKLNNLHKQKLKDIEDFKLANQQLVCNLRAHAEVRALLLAQARTARVGACANLEKLFLIK